MYERWQAVSGRTVSWASFTASSSSNARRAAERASDANRGAAGRVAGLLTCFRAVACAWLVAGRACCAYMRTVDDHVSAQLCLQSRT